MTRFIDLLLHADRYLLDLVGAYGSWIYAILFAIVFAETGLVVTPLLPGDSLLFATGAIAATGVLDVRLAFVDAWAREVVLGPRAGHVGRSRSLT